ncbi:MAG: ABC transporter ATP-binding protein [Motiliproteus sp.]|nr:ABC transporter ATP-binding protein [Motiliproteus sp.]MCW9052849.1 ABC transporter ATP-binding protein [Motiliproteus sp.]
MSANITAEKVLEIRQLSKSFEAGSRRQQVLDQVDLDLRRGEVVVLLGASGSGKSTLLNLIAGLEYADRGRISINGREQTALDEQQRTLFRRRHIGVVFQFFNLIPTLNVAENLSLPLQLNDLPVDQQRLDRFLDQLGIAQLTDLYPEQISGGEQQRVAIARAMIHQPALLLADEPTGSLDNATADRVSSMLFKQVREQGQSLILVTHNESLSQYADRVLRLKDDRFQKSDAEPIGEEV